MSNMLDVTVQLLHRELSIRCPASEQDKLLASAKCLNEQLLKIQATDHSIPFEKLLMLAALNTTYEKLYEANGEELITTANADINKLEKKLADALAQQDQMEL